MAAPTMLELGIVVEARTPTATGVVCRLLRDAEITVTPFDTVMAERALDAWRRFGRGRHPAGLDLGGCFSYALAVATGCPILCVGDEFTRTGLPRPVAAGGAGRGLTGCRAASQVCCGRGRSAGGSRRSSRG